MHIYRVHVIANNQFIKNINITRTKHNVMNKSTTGTTIHHPLQ